MKQRKRACWRRSIRGLSLFGSLLALALLGMVVLGVTVFLETQRMEGRARLAAAQLAVLASAAESDANSRFPQLLVLAAGGPTEITLVELRANGLLPASFGDVDALGRGWRVLVLAAGADAFDLLVTETVPAGDTVLPASALLATHGAVRLGMIAPDTPAQLMGPALDADVSGFQAVFGGVPEPGALAVLARLDHQSVFGDHLHRVAVPGFAAANRMETDLDMDGNAITGAGELEAQSLSLSGDLEASGDITVTGDLVIGRALLINGLADVGALTAGEAVIAGTLTSAEVTVSGSLQAAGITASGTVEAASIGAAGAIAAGSATLGALNAGEVTARTVTATDVTATSVTAEALQVNTQLDAASAGISVLTVGSCTGCGP